MEGLNDHLRFQMKLAGAKMGAETEDSGEGSQTPISGDIGASEGIKIERVS